MAAIAFQRVGALREDGYAHRKSQRDNAQTKLALIGPSKCRATTDAALIEALGEPQVATLAEQGAALEIPTRSPTYTPKPTRRSPRHNTRADA